MAYPHSFLFIAILLFSTATMTNCFVINGTNILNFQILGQVTCDNPPMAPKPFLSGTTVGLACTDNRADLARAKADANGFYKIVYNTVESVPFEPGECFTCVQLPIARCRVYPSTGTLVARLALVGLLEPNTGPIAVIAAGPFELAS